MKLAAAWVTCALAAVAAIGCGDDGSEDPRRRERDTRDRIEAKMQQEIAEKAAKRNMQAAETAFRQKQADLLTAQLDLLFGEVTKVEQELLQATDADGRARALERLEFLRVELDQVKMKLEVVKRSGTSKCPPDDPLC